MDNSVLSDLPFHNEEAAFDYVEASLAGWSDLSALRQHRPYRQA